MAALWIWLLQVFLHKRKTIPCFCLHFVPNFGQRFLLSFANVPWVGRNPELSYGFFNVVESTWEMLVWFIQLTKLKKLFWIQEEIMCLFKICLYLILHVKFYHPSKKWALPYPLTFITQSEPTAGNCSWALLRHGPKNHSFPKLKMLNFIWCSNLCN